MSASRILLIEELLAAGSDVADARDRAALLRATGATVRVVTLEPRRALAALPDRGSGHAPPHAIARGCADLAGFAQVRALAREGRYDFVLVAGSGPVGSRALAAPPRGAMVRRWMTGVPGPTGWLARFAAGLPAISIDAGGDGADPAPGITWSTLDREQVRRKVLPLWDGEYVLAPCALEGPAGRAALEAFGAAAAEWNGLDLVVLADPQPQFEQRARALGIGMRVHFVGSAPRDAEWAWWSQASAALFAGRAPVAGGLVLRGLAIGCPLLPVGEEPPAPALRAWLARHGCQVGAGDSRSNLAAMLDRTAAIEHSIARGRALAAQHDPAKLGGRLAEALETSPRRLAPERAVA